MYVRIQQNEVALFAPFANRDYRNNWGHLLRLEGGEEGQGEG